MMENFNIIPFDHKVTLKDRNRLNGHKSMMIWFTGLSGSGKSSIASRLEQLLLSRGIHTYILDGDNIRTGLCRGLSFSEADRSENLRRVAEVSKLFVDAGIVVLGAFVSPMKADREKARSIIGADRFVEIYIATPFEECERRDVKGLYRKARKGEIDNFTGLSAPYEAPENPDLVLETERRSIDECALMVLNFLLELKKIEQI